MDLYFDDRPCSSESSQKNSHGDSQKREDSHDLPKGKSSSVGFSDIQEQQSSSSIDDISRSVQEIVENINNSRTSDQKVMDSFEPKFIEKVTQMLQQMKEHMYTVYEENSSVMQVKLQELSEVLERCTKLNKELVEASQVLAGLREGLAIIKTVEP